MSATSGTMPGRGFVIWLAVDKRMGCPYRTVRRSRLRPPSRRRETTIDGAITIVKRLVSMTEERLPEDHRGVHFLPARRERMRGFPPMWTSAWILTPRSGHANPVYELLVERTCGRAELDYARRQARPAPRSRTHRRERLNAHDRMAVISFSNGKVIASVDDATAGITPDRHAGALSVPYEEAECRRGTDNRPVAAPIVKPSFSSDAFPVIPYEGPYARGHQPRARISQPADRRHVRQPPGPDRTFCCSRRISASSSALDRPLAHFAIASPVYSLLKREMEG